MASAMAAFRRCVINAPEFGSDETHIGSRIFFDLAVEGVSYANLYVDVRQRVDDETDQHPLLVSRPQKYEGPFNTSVFQGLVEFYYRHAVGAKWSMFGMKGIGMRLEGWTVEQEMLVQFEVFEEDASNSLFQ